MTTKKPIFQADFASLQPGFRDGNIRTLRRILSEMESEPTSMPSVSFYTEKGLIPVLLTLLRTSSEDAEIADLATSVIMRMSHWTEVAVKLVDRGALPVLLDLMRKPKTLQGTCAALALNNLGQSSSSICDSILACGGFDLLLAGLASSQDSWKEIPDFLDATARCVLCFVDKAKKWTAKHTKLALPLLSNLLLSKNSVHVFRAAFALQCIFERGPEHTRTLTSETVSCILARLVQLLTTHTLTNHHEDPAFPALQALEHMFKHRDTCPNQFVRLGGLAVLRRALAQNNDDLRSLVCGLVPHLAWGRSASTSTERMFSGFDAEDVTVGNSGNVQKLLESGVVNRLLALLHLGEAVTAVRQIVSVASLNQIKYMAAKLGILAALCAALGDSAYTATGDIKKSLAFILAAGDLLVARGDFNGDNPYVKVLRAKGLLDAQYAQYASGLKRQHTNYNKLVKAYFTGLGHSYLPNHFPRT